MPVSTKKQDYTEMLPVWTLTRDAVEGSKAVKDKGTTYLPQPCPDDNSPENSARYAQYKQRANYVNFTGPTLQGLLGMVFRDDVNIELPPALEYMQENATGNGLTLDQLIRRLISEQAITGRYGLLVDYPDAPKGLTQAEVMARNLRASILAYPAESVINWGTINENGITKLGFVVLEESKKVPGEDPFAPKFVKAWRVLRYEDGVYTQEIYDDNENLVEVLYPTRSDGAPWSEIPFIFAGSENNDDTADKPLLYDVAEVNIAHYVNSADFEDSCHMSGQPTPAITGLTQSWADEYLKGSIKLGSRTGLLLPEGADAKFLEVTGNLMPERGMEAKERQLVKIGARIIMDNVGNETVDAARMRFAGQTSPLAVVVGNAEQAINQCLEWAAAFMGAPDGGEIVINREFYDKSIDAQTIMAHLQMLDRGVIAMSDMRAHLRASGSIDNDRTDEEIDEEAEQVDPTL